MLHQLATAGLAIHPRQHNGVGGGIDQPILRFQPFKISSLADVAMQHTDAALLQPLDVAPAAAPTEVVDAGDLQIADQLLKGQTEFGAHETAGPGD